MRCSPPYRLLLLLAACVLPACSLFTSAEQLRTSGDDALARGDTSKAIKSYQALLGKDESDPYIFAELGAMLRSRDSIRDRKRSEDILDRGLQKHPDSPEVNLEIAKTYYAQGFYGDAARRFRKVLELDPGNCDAHYYLGLNDFRRWKHIQIYTDYLFSCRGHFALVTECGPQNHDAYYKLALSLYVLADTTKCKVVADEFGRTHRNRPEPYFMLGVLAYDTDDFEEAGQLFELAFLRLLEDEQAAYEDIELLLPDGDELEAYKLSSDEHKEELRRTFWRESDPDLTTPQNERWVEHVYRTFLADARYALPHLELRGWETARGKALIKFGKPQAIGSTLAGGFTTGRTEQWVYPDNYTFVFQDQFLNGNYEIPMGARYEFLYQAIAFDPAVTTIAYELVAVPGLMDAFSFKGSDVSSDVYVAYRIDRDSLDIFVDLEEVNRFVARSAIYDGAWQSQGYFADTLSTRRFASTNTFDQGVIIRRFELPFNEHHFAVCVEDDLELTRTHMTAFSSTLRFLGSGLSMSDVMFYYEPDDVSAGNLVTRNGRDFAPKLNGRYYKDEKLRLYVELYNLGVAAGQSRYDITYSIFPDKRNQGTVAKLAGALRRMAGFINTPEPVVSQTLVRTGAAHDGYEDLAIDITSLSPGRYLLEITVKDNVEDDEATITRPFRKLSSARPAN